MECIYKAAPGLLPALNQRRGDDPRMTRAVAARLANPEVSLHQALLMGGFKFSKNIMHDTISAPFTYRNSSIKNNMKNREGGIYDCDNILLSQRKKQLRKRLHLIAVYNKNKKDKTTERKEGFHSSTYCNIRKENSTAAGHHAATGAMLGMNTAVKMVSATEHTSSKNASYHSTHAVLQDAINELQVLKEIESSLNQEIHTFTSSCSSSVIQNTMTLQDCFKPVRDDNSIIVHPTILEDQSSIPLVYQKDAMNTAIHPPLLSLNLNKRSQPDLFWPTHLQIPRGDPLSLLYHPQHPHSANRFRGMTMRNYLAATSCYHNSRRMRRYEYITLLNEMKKKKKHQLYRDALMLAGPRDDFRNNKILGKSKDEK
jgi:hypothetical protein